MLIAVDIGNSRIKFGAYAQAPTKGLPEPDDVLELTGENETDWQRVVPWLNSRTHGLQWIVGSVNRDGLARFQQWRKTQLVAKVLIDDSERVLTYRDLPLSIRPEHPERIGIDRLLGAVGANALRPSGIGAVTLHLGSALTANLIDDEGVFRGGAILPGIGMSARALHEFTDLLPLIPMRELHEAPEPVGAATVSAMRSGLYWGAIGAMKELLARFSAQLSNPPEVYFTGGAAPSVVTHLAPQAKHVPQLILGALARVGVSLGQKC